MYLNVLKPQSVSYSAEDQFCNIISKDKVPIFGFGFGIFLMPTFYCTRSTKGKSNIYNILKLVVFVTGTLSCSITSHKTFLFQYNC